MSRKNFIIYIVTAIGIFSIVLIPIFCPSLKDNDSLMLMMQGLNILVFLHISYKLSTEDKNKFVNQQKLDNERLHKQLRFDLVKKYVNEFELYIKETQNVKEFTHLGQFYLQEISRFEILDKKFNIENLKLMNIFNSTEYDRFLYIQTNLREEFYKFEGLTLHLEKEKEYFKDDLQILEIDEHYVNALSYLSLITDYLYYILLNNAEDYELDKKLKITKEGFEKFKLKHII